MATKAEIDNFMALKSLAVVGVSRNTRKFGYSIFQSLKTSGYKVFAINPNASTIEGDPCYPNLSALPEKVEGIVIVLPPDQTEMAVQDAKNLGIKNIWMQQGAESKNAVQFCKDNGLQVITGECILMFPRPTAFIHRFHGFFKNMGRK
jgi:uncharacterized protein